MFTRNKIRKVRPTLEALETRFLPAVRPLPPTPPPASPGPLITINMTTSNILTVDEVGTNLFKVTEGVKVLGTYSTYGITVNGTNIDDIITFNLINGGITNLTVNSGYGSDTVTINGSTATAMSNFIFSGSNGDDKVNVGLSSKISLTNMSLDGGLGVNSLSVAGGTGVVGCRNVTPLSFTNMTFGTGFSASQAITVPVGTSTPENLLLDSGASTNTLKYTGSIGSDSVVILGTVVGNTGPSTVAIDIDTRAGNDFIDLESNSKGMKLVGGDGFDTLYINDGVTLSGDVSISMVGSANDPGNSYNFGFGGAGVSVGGNLSILNTFTDINGHIYGNIANQTIDYKGSVGGSLNVQLGDGDQNFSFTGTLGGKFSLANFTSLTNTLGGAGSGSGDVTANITATNFTWTIGPLGSLTYGVNLGTGFNNLNFLGGSPYNFVLYNNLLVGHGAVNNLTFPVSSVWKDQNGFAVDPFMFFF